MNSSQVTAMAKPRPISVTCRYYPSISRPRQHSARQARRIAANIATLPGPCNNGLHLVP